MWERRRLRLDLLPLIVMAEGGGRCAALLGRAGCCRHSSSSWHRAEYDRVWDDDVNPNTISNAQNQVYEFLHMKCPFCR